MKQGDILMLMDGIAPAIASLLGKAMAPMLARLESTEKELAAATAALAERPDVAGMIATAISPIASRQDDLAKALNDRPQYATAKELAELAGAHSEVREIVAALPGVPTAEEVAALVQVPQPKEINPEEIKAVATAEVARQIADLPPPPAPAEIDAGALAAEVEKRVVVAIKTEITSAVAALPAGPTAEEVAALVKTPTAEEVAALIPPAEPGAPGRNVTVDDVAPMIEEAVSKAVAALPVAQNGADASPEQIAAAVAKYLVANPPKDGDSVTLDQIRPLIEEATAKHVGALPAAKDGVGLAGALIDRDGNLVLTLTDGATKSLGLVVGKDGLPGKPGVDGFNLDDFEVVDGTGAFTLRFVRGAEIKEFTLPKPTLADAYRGVWREGPHKAGSVVTWGGSIWLAKRDTEDRPETSDAWTLIVKKGRDGKDGEAPKGPAKVKL